MIKVDQNLKVIRIASLDLRPRPWMTVWGDVNARHPERSRRVQENKAFCAWIPAASKLQDDGFGGEHAPIF